MDSAPSGDPPNAPSYQPTPNDQRNAFGNISMRSRTFLEWDSTAWMVSGIMDTVGLCAEDTLSTIFTPSVKAALGPTAEKLLELAPQVPAPLR